jgi:hypothetical protein
MLGRRQVEADDIADLLDKEGIGRELEGFGAMRLEVERLPYPMNRRGREACGLRHGAQAPVRRGLRRRPQRPANDFRDLLGADLTRRPWSRFVHQTVEAIVREPIAPLADGVRRSLHPQGDGPVLQPVRRQNNDPRPLSKALRRSPPRGQTLKLDPLAFIQFDRNRRSAHRGILRATIAKNQTYLSIRTLGASYINDLSGL